MSASERPIASDRGERHQVQVIARAAAILRSLEAQPQGLSLGQIASQVGLARSTVQRIVAALAAEQLLIAASPSGRARLGPAILRLSTSVDIDVAALARPALVELSAKLRETVDFAAVRGDYLVFIDQVVGPERLRTVSAIGETFPLYCTANGKAHLASLPDAAVATLIGQRYPARTPNTLTTFAALTRDLDQVRRSGFALDRQEHVMGINAVGVVLSDMLGNPVAISVPVPSTRFAGRENTIADALLETRQRLCEQFQHCN